MQILNQPSDLLPWSSPTYIPNAPHNLPKREQQTTSERSGVSFSGESVSVRNNYQYASLVTASITVGTTSIKFLDQPIGKRNLLSFRNASATQTLYIDFNSQATTGSWLALSAGALILFDAVVPQDDLYVISSASGGQLAYAYSTYPG